MLDHGKKWATDEPLRKYMSEIRAALAAKQGGIHKGTLAPEDYKALGTLVEARVATIVAECKLEPAADANLHRIVAELIAGADARSVKDCVDQLDAGPKQAIALAFYQGLSHSELAAHLREPLGTIKSWVRRGLERLRNCLDRTGYVRSE